MTTAPEPGWYPDPAGSDELLRWWDGQAWTDQVRASTPVPPPAVPPPAATVPSEPAEVTSPVGHPAEVPRAAGGAGAPTTGVESVDSPSRSTVMRFLALGCGFAVFVAAGLGVGLMIWREPGADTAYPGSATATPRAAGDRTAAVGRLDESTGVATIGPASMTLPGSPYEVYDDPVTVAGVLDAFFVANAVVHEDYDGSRTWWATVGLAHVSPDLASSSDLERSGSDAMMRLSRQLFGGHATTVRRLSFADRAVDGHPGALFTAEVHYAVAGLASRYDTVTALVVRLDDGSLVLALSSVPDDASAQLKRLAADSLGTLTVS